MLTLERLKNYLHRDFSQVDKVLLILGALDRTAQVAEIRETGRNAGLREIDKWNVSYLLSRAKGLAANTAAGWELLDEGRRRLGVLGFTTMSQPTRQQILKAVDVISGWGHSTFDRMLLEFGIDDLHAGREVGSLSSRGNALAKFALANPTVVTAEGIPIGLAILDYAKGPQSTAEPSSASGGFAKEIELVEQDASEVHNERSAVAAAITNSGIAQVSRSKVFLVHGRDAGAMHEVARFLEKLGIEVTILHERPNRGRTLISKFEQESADIGYAVVLMTPDDVGGLKGENSNGRARQNVVFELGFFIGRLGASNVCALVTRGVERPSDFESVVYVEYDGGKWKTELARELRAAGISFDHSKVF